MDLETIRTKFVDLTGRFDLVVDTTNYVDNGANFFIQAGQRLLDSLPFSGREKEAKWLVNTVAGETVVASPAVLAVKSVRIEKTDGSYYLQKVRYDNLRESYGDIDGFPNTDAAAPVYYTPITRRDIDTPTTSTESIRGIFLMPPPDAIYQLEIEGLFRSVPLLVDADESFWSIVYPETLIQAAWYEIERFYRNTQGMKDHMEAISRDLQGIDFDAVEEDIASIDHMKDSWRFN